MLMKICIFTKFFQNHDVYRLLNCYLICQERDTACCLREDQAGCVQTQKSECKSAEGHNPPRTESLGPGGGGATRLGPHKWVSYW